METLSFLMGLAIGLLTVGAAGIVCAIAQHAIWFDDAYWLFPLWLTATCSGWLVGVVIQFKLAKRENTINVRLKEAQTWALELNNQEREVKLQPAPPQVVVMRNVPTSDGGAVEMEEMHSANWLAWRRSLLDTLAWARRVGRIDGPALIAAGAFSRPDDWQAVTDVLQASGLLTPKRNGVRSELAYSVSECQRLVRDGKFTAPEGLPPKVAPLQPLQSFPSSTEGVALPPTA